MSGFSFDGLSIWAKKHRGHETEGTVTLSYNVRLNIAIVVFAGPDKATAALNCLGDHIVNKSVLIIYSLCLVLRAVLLLINRLEYILETTVLKEIQAKRFSFEKSK